LGKGADDFARFSHRFRRKKERNDAEGMGGKILRKKGGDHFGEGEMGEMQIGRHSLTKRSGERNSCLRVWLERERFRLNYTGGEGGIQDAGSYNLRSEEEASIRTGIQFMRKKT